MIGQEGYWLGRLYNGKSKKIQIKSAELDNSKAVALCGPFLSL